MADIQKTVSILFKGDDQVTVATNKVEASLDSLSSKVTGALQPFSDLADSVLKVDTALAALVAGGIALAISKASDFQASFNEIVTISGATGGSVDKFREDILRYAQDSSAGLTDINSAVYKAISAGVSYKDSLALLKVSEELSVAGRATLGETTLALVSSLNAYGAGTDQAAKYSDALFTAVRIGQTTLPELATALSQVTGIAAAGGVSFDTLTAATAALTASGLPTTQAVTGIKAALSNIIKPSDEAEKAAAALGISFDATTLKTKGFDGILRSVYQATGGNIESMGKLFGSVEGLNAVMVLGADKSGKFREALDAMANNTGATAAAYALMADNFDLATKRLSNNVTVFLTDIGTRLLPTATQDMTSLSNFFKSIDLSLKTGAFDSLFAAFDQAGLAVKEFLDQISVSFPEAIKQVDFSKLIEALKDLGGSFGDLFGDFDPSDPEDVAEAIQWVVDSIESLIHITKGMIDQWAPFVTGIINSIDAFNSLDDQTKESSGSFLALAKAIVDGGVLIAAALVTIGQNADVMKAVFEAISGAIGVTWNTITLALQKIADDFLGFVQTVNSIIDTFTFGALHDQLTAGEQSIEAWRTKLQAGMVKDVDEGKAHLITFGEAIDSLAAGTDTAAAGAEKLGTSIKDLPDTKTVKTELTYEEALEQVKKITTGIATIPDEKNVAIGAEANEASFTETAQKVAEWVPDERGVLVYTGADHPALADTKKTIEENIPAEKKMSIQAEVDIAKIKAQTDVIKSYFDFKAKVDVAEIEAAAKVSVAAFESLNVTLTTTGGLLNTLFGLFLEADVFEQTSIEAWINAQLELQKAAVENQTALVKAQVKYLESKAAAMDRGDAMITISGDGLAPELEAFMFAVIERVQVRVAEEHAEFLLGIGV